MNAQELIRKMLTGVRVLPFAALLVMGAGLANADTWDTAPPMPTPRSALAATNSTDGSKIYALGGSISGSVLNTVEVYDVPARTWRPASAMPTAREDLAAATERSTRWAGKTAPTRRSIRWRPTTRLPAPGAQSLRCRPRAPRWQQRRAKTAGSTPSEAATTATSLKTSWRPTIR